jgi:hypothetical protein
VRVYILTRGVEGLDAITRLSRGAITSYIPESESPCHNFILTRLYLGPSRRGITYIGKSCQIPIPPRRRKNGINTSRGGVVNSEWKGLKFDASRRGVFSTPTPQITRRGIDKGLVGIKNGFEGQQEAGKLSTKRYVLSARRAPEYTIQW